jgi:flagellum-specific peptidoglycan hydrolase FlgJ
MVQNEQDGFIESVAPMAQASAEKFGISASVTIAQAILESAWGKSQLARQCLNFFGIKLAKHEAGDYQEFKTTEYVNGKPISELDKFRKFRTIQECFDRHAQILMSLSRYAPARAAANDPDMFAIELQRCGYSTDPGYPTKLAKLIARYSLGRFDAKGKA